jgi:hypothetical protein
MPSGICGFTVTTKNSEIEPAEIAKPIKVPAKLIQKIKEREIF